MAAALAAGRVLATGGAAPSSNAAGASAAARNVGLLRVWLALVAAMRLLSVYLGFFDVARFRTNLFPVEPAQGTWSVWPGESTASFLTGVVMWRDLYVGRGGVVTELYVTEVLPQSTRAHACMHHVDLLSAAGTAALLPHGRR